MNVGHGSRVVSQCCAKLERGLTLMTASLAVNHCPGSPWRPCKLRELEGLFTEDPGRSTDRRSGTRPIVNPDWNVDQSCPESLQGCGNLTSPIRLLDPAYEFERAENLGGGETQSGTWQIPVDFKAPGHPAQDFVSRNITVRGRTTPFFFTPLSGHSPSQQWHGQMFSCMHVTVNNPERAHQRGRTNRSFLPTPYLPHVLRVNTGPHLLLCPVTHHQPATG